MLSEVTKDYKVHRRILKGLKNGVAGAFEFVQDILRSEQISIQ